MTLLAELLGVPDNIKIIEVAQSFEECVQGIFKVCVAGPELHPVAPGEHIPRMILVHYKGPDGKTVRIELK
jgi:hypothetical protein